ncbi:MAG: molecular chaperone TorD family protein [Candidatus Thiodiazotropha sp. (ex Lucinoma annulata)]|nr:molecular chaperone TorD family protein [Candidatus Thiodiazotropha sp. (ex Lucinoma borealis)]MCU7841089.1 molecular chaperone TorD family protein [Candidatus Thiodiazotropha sp. (ex Troendleina suluensis)]MCU7884622.1 molecular chaperone TorD family protein [Candidatus Thiodiazotropha sp. (ex Lucinoma annulata)]MCU7856741.1 molecular chaperone TorD family protein [Candidatus Thiodiazotropha sp. (ex Lucinoma borealis)]MCU7862661.1 molecular chaperone TorD family protein [Candidatus Thiodiaz
MPADYLGTQLECSAYLSESIRPDRSKLLKQLWQDHLQRRLPSFC